MAANMGLVQAAREIESYGRGPDTTLAHISPDEAEFIDYLQGGRKTNPHTGLAEYSAFGKILKAVARAGASYVGYYYGGPLGAAAATGLTTKLTGGSWNEAAKAAVMAGVGSYAAQGLSGAGWGAAGNNTALSNALEGSAGASGAGAGAGAGVGAGDATAAGLPSGGSSGLGASLASSEATSPLPNSPGFWSNLENGGLNSQVAAGSIEPALSATAPAALSGSAPSATTGLGLLSGLTSHVPGGTPALMAAYGGLTGAPLSHEEDDDEQPPPGYGGTVNLNVAPLARAYRAYAGDPTKFGEKAGGWSFFDEVNPKPVYLAQGGGAMGPRQPGAGMQGLGGIRQLGVPSQLQAPQFGGLQRQQLSTSPEDQRMALRRAAVLGYMNAKDGGPVRGPGGPTDDEVPAMLSSDENVWDAATVKLAGKGSYERGHRAMQRMKERVRREAGMKHPSKPPAFGGA